MRRLIRRISSRPRLAATALAAIGAVAVVVGIAVLLRGGPEQLPPGKITWAGGFEEGGLRPWSQEQQYTSGRVSVVSSPTRQGRYAARFEVDPGDNNVAGSGSGERAEVLTGNAIEQSGYGSEDWLAFSTMFDPTFQPTANSYWNNFVQFHYDGGTGQASAFRVYNNQIVLTIYGGTVSNPVDKSWVLDSSRQNGVWYDFVVHIKWSPDPSVGFVEVWMSKNGAAPVKVVPFTHLSDIYDGLGVYLKEGYYRAPNNTKAIIYHDGMRVATGYGAAVAAFPRGKWPSVPPS